MLWSVSIQEWGEAPASPSGGVTSRARAGPLLALSGHPPSSGRGAVVITIARIGRPRLAERSSPHRGHVAAEQQGLGLPWCLTANFQAAGS